MQKSVLAMLLTAMAWMSACGASAKENEPYEFSFLTCVTIEKGDTTEVGGFFSVCIERTGAENHWKFSVDGKACCAGSLVEIKDDAGDVTALFVDENRKMACGVARLDDDVVIDITDGSREVKFFDYLSDDMELFNSFEKECRSMIAPSAAGVAATPVKQVFFLNVDGLEQCEGSELRNAYYRTLAGGHFRHKGVGQFMNLPQLGALLSHPLGNEGLSFEVDSDREVLEALCRLDLPFEGVYKVHDAKYGMTNTFVDMGMCKTEQAVDVNGKRGRMFASGVMIMDYDKDGQLKGLGATVAFEPGWFENGVPGSKELKKEMKRRFNMLLKEIKACGYVVEKKDGRHWFWSADNKRCSVWYEEWGKFCLSVYKKLNK